MIEKEKWENDIKAMRNVELADVFSNYKHLIECYEDMKGKLVPFGVGDRVVLDSHLKINRDSGWYIYRKCLVKGTEGTVLDISWNPYTHEFQACVQIQNTTWIDDMDVERPSDDVCFWFNTSDLKPL